MFLFLFSSLNSSSYSPILSRLMLTFTYEKINANSVTSLPKAPNEGIYGYTKIEVITCKLENDILGFHVHGVFLWLIFVCGFHDLWCLFNLQVVQYVRAIRKGLIKFDEKPKEEPSAYLLWGDDSTAIDRQGLAYIPAPKPKLPGMQPDHLFLMTVVYIIFSVM